MAIILSTSAIQGATLEHGPTGVPMEVSYNSQLYAARNVAYSNVGMRKENEG